MAGRRKAFSLVELLLIVLFLGIFAAIAIPSLSFSALSKQKADIIARKIVTDLRRTRRLAISNAAANPNGFALNMTGSSPYTGYEIENLNTSVTIDSHTIDTDVSCAGGDEFSFGPLGNLLAGSDSSLTVSAHEKIFTISIISATGTVKCSEN